MSRMNIFIIPKEKKRSLVDTYGAQMFDVNNNNNN